MLWTWTFATHHQVENRFISEKPFPIDMKKCDDSPHLTTSMQQFWHWILFPPSVKWKWQKSTFCSFALCQSPCLDPTTLLFLFFGIVCYTSIYANTVNSNIAHKLLLDLTQSSFCYQNHDYAKLSSPLESPGLQNLFLLLVCLVSAKCCVSQQAPCEIWTTTSRMCADWRTKGRTGLERDLYFYSFATIYFRTGSNFALCSWQISRSTL